MDGREWLESYQQRVRGMQERAERAQAALAAVEGTATSPDGAVTATVAPGGGLRRLVIAERHGLTSTQLAAAVVATAGSAAAAAARAAGEAVEPLFGRDSAAMRLLRDSVGAP